MNKKAENVENKVDYLEQFVIKVDQNGVPTAATNGKKLSITAFLDAMEEASNTGGKIDLAQQSIAVENKHVVDAQAVLDAAKDKENKAKDQLEVTKSSFGALMLAYAQLCADVVQFKTLCNTIEHQRQWGKASHEHKAPSVYTQYKSDIIRGWNKGINPGGVEYDELNLETGKVETKKLEFKQYSGKEGFRTVLNKAKLVNDKLVMEVGVRPITLADKIFTDLKGVDETLARDMGELAMLYAGSQDTQLHEEMVNSLRTLAQEFAAKAAKVAQKAA